jgi:hypothetical protein
LAAQKAVIREEMEIIRRIARQRRPKTEEELCIIYRSNIAGPGGEIILADLCERFHIASTTRGQYDPPECRDSEQIRRDGERNVVLYILNKVFQPIEDKNDA